MQTGYGAINKYNAYVMGVHNYYAIATLVSMDFNQIAFGVRKSLSARLKDGVKRAGKDPPKYIKERYGNSKELRYIYNTAIIPLAILLPIPFPFSSTSKLSICMLFFSYIPSE